jgi:integrase
MKPTIIKRGSYEVRIREEKSSANGQAIFRVTHNYLEGYRKAFADYEKAVTAATEQADRLAAGQTLACAVDNTMATVWGECQRLLQPYDVSILVAVQKFTEAIKLLDGEPYISTIEEGLKRRRSVLAIKTVPEAVNEFKVWLQSSERDRRDMFGKVDALAAKFRGPIVDLSGTEIETWISAMQTKQGEAITKRTRFNWRNAIVRFTNFCKQRRYLPKDWEEMDYVSKGSTRVGEIEVFSPDEMAKILAHCTDRFLPFVVIGAFAGLRSAEIERLDWEDIRLDDSEPHIEVKESVGDSQNKTGRRIVPVLPVLDAWLRPMMPKEGKGKLSVNWPYFSIEYLAKRAGVTWKKNALRHSFISYRVAVTKNAAQVAEEAGNSVQMIKKHYLKRTLEREAARYFNIMPQSKVPENVVKVGKVA